MAALTLQEILAMKVDLFTLDTDDDNTVVTIICKSIDPHSISISLEYGELSISASNEDIVDTKSVFLGSEYSLDNMNKKIIGNRIILEFDIQD